MSTHDERPTEGMGIPTPGRGSSSGGPAGPITLRSHEFFAAGDDPALLRAAASRPEASRPEASSAPPPQVTGAIDAREMPGPTVPPPITMATTRPPVTHDAPTVVGPPRSLSPSAPTAAPPASIADVPSRVTGPIVVPTSSPAWVVTGIVVVLAAFAGAVLFFELREERAARVAASEEHARELTDAREEAVRAKADSAEKDVRIKLLERDKEALAIEKALQDAELARLKKMEDELAARVSSEIVRGDIKVGKDGANVTIDLVDKLLFDSGEAEISARGKEVLTRLGAVLATTEDRNVQVVGHTDDSPPNKKVAERFPSNWELSVARATNVVRFLQEEAKVPGKRLIAVGRGQHHPVATNANHKGRARNRRIEILLTPIAPVAVAPR